MANLITPSTRQATRSPRRPDFRELARWDGSLLTIDTAPYLAHESGGGPVLVRIRVATGNPAASGAPVWDETYQPMARIPMASELMQLVAAAAAGNRRQLRILLVVDARALDEDEARAAWGDR